MDISVTDFKQRCLEIVRRVEHTGQPVTITRRGKVVAHLEPSVPDPGTDRQPWARLRMLGGALRAEAGDHVIREEDFEAAR